MHRGSGPDFPGFSQKEIDELFLDSSEDKNETLKELKVTINLNDDDHKEILAMTKTAKKTKMKKSVIQSGQPFQAKPKTLQTKTSYNSHCRTASRCHHFSG